MYQETVVQAQLLGLTDEVTAELASQPNYTVISQMLAYGVLGLIDVSLLVYLMKLQWDLADLVKLRHSVNSDVFKLSWDVRRYSAEYAALTKLDHTLYELELGLIDDLSILPNMNEAEQLYFRGRVSQSIEETKTALKEAKVYLSQDTYEQVRHYFNRLRFQEFRPRVPGAMPDVSHQGHTALGKAESAQAWSTQLTKRLERYETDIASKARTSRMTFWQTGAAFATTVLMIGVTEFSLAGGSESLEDYTKTHPFAFYTTGQNPQVAEKIATDPTYRETFATLQAQYAQLTVANHKYTQLYQTFLLPAAGLNESLKASDIPAGYPLFEAIDTPDTRLGARIFYEPASSGGLTISSLDVWEKGTEHDSKLRKLKINAPPFVVTPDKTPHLSPSVSIPYGNKQKGCVSIHLYQGCEPALLASRTRIFGPRCIQGNHLGRTYHTNVSSSGPRSGKGESPQQQAMDYTLQMELDAQKCR